MRINEQNILVITLEDWKTSGLTIFQYRNATVRKQFKVATNGGNGRKLEIIYESMLPRFKEAVVSKFGNPYEYVAEQEILRYLKYDQKAFKYFSNVPDKRRNKYVETANWLNLAIDLEQNLPSKKIAKEFKANKWKVFLKVAKGKNAPIPTSYARFRNKLNDYIENEYEAIRHEGEGNTFSQKITEDGAQFLIDHYGLPTKPTIVSVWQHYNDVADKYGWKPLKDSRRVHQFLYLPENQPKWFAGRHGAHKATERFGYQLRTKLPEYRDALWYSDGTKLNFFYKKHVTKTVMKNGKPVERTVLEMKADQVVYEIMDVYSEMLLGFAIGKTENYSLMYAAAKMAMQTSHAKPYEWKYDGQGGHKKLKNEGFLSKLSKISVRTQPYNGKSKTIESAFGRFQQYIMRELWFFTGQNIDSKSENSKANMEFIIANKKNLPTLEEAIKAYEACRKKWVEQEHYKYKQPKRDLYFNSENPDPIKIDELDMVEMFWLTKAKPITYYNHGITVEIKGNTYEFEVLKKGMPDREFRKKHLYDKFIVKYDPENLSHIRLYKETPEGLLFITVAEPRIVVHRAAQDQKDGDRKLINDLLDVRKQDAEDLRNSIPETIINEDHTVSVAAWEKQKSLATGSDGDDYLDYI